MASPIGYSIPSHVLYAYDIYFFIGKILKLSRTRSTSWINMTLFLVSLWIIIKVTSILLPLLLVLIGKLIRLSTAIKALCPLTTWEKVPIFASMPKARFLQPWQIRWNLSLGKSLSMMGRIQLFNTVVTGVLSYNFNFYKWSSSLLKQINKWIRNFIWTGDIMMKGSTMFN